MKLLAFSILISFSVNSWAQGEILGEQPLSLDSDDVVISAEAFQNLQLEDPVFPSRKFERDVATLNEEVKHQDVEWQGQLAVVKEIPYSYPWLTHTTLQLRTLNEIEAEEAKSSN